MYADIAPSAANSAERYQQAAVAVARAEGTRRSCAVFTHALVYRKCRLGAALANELKTGNVGVLPEPARAEVSRREIPAAVTTARMIARDFPENDAHAGHCCVSWTLSQSGQRRAILACMGSIRDLLPNLSSALSSIAHVDAPGGASACNNSRPIHDVKGEGSAT